MPGNNTSKIVHYFAGKYPGKIGWIQSPDSWVNPPYYMPYALDNGAYKYFDPDKYRKHLLRASKFHSPLWVALPDVLGNTKETILLWDKWYPVLHETGYKLAFIAQDGMLPQDIPKEAHCVFIGGKTNWKLKNAHKFKGVSNLLHIGRVNTIKRLCWAIDIGADSCDGTGWFLKNPSGFVKLFEKTNENSLKPFFDISPILTKNKNV